MSACMKEMELWPQRLSALRGHRDGRSGDRYVSVLRYSSTRRALCVNRDRREDENVLQPLHPVSPLGAFMKTKSSLASSSQPIISYSNKTKGNCSHFLLILSCLNSMLGGRNGVTEFSQFWSSLTAKSARIAALSLTSKSIAGYKHGAFSRVALCTLSHFRGYELHVALKQKQNHLIYWWGTVNFRCVCNQNWVCACVRQGLLSVLSVPQLQQRTWNTEQRGKH